MGEHNEPIHAGARAESYNEELKAAFFRLYEITRRLRAEHGCPWDNDQTPLSIRRDLMEEAFEAIDAITSGDTPHVREELGDVLFNVVLLARMYEQSGDFTLAHSLNDISDKLIRRHPHVFPNSEGKAQMSAPATTSDTVLSQWDAIKEHVEGRKGESALDDVPQGFPPLLRAYKLLKKAAKKGFTWQTAEDARAKLDEELREVSEAAAEVSRAKAPPNAEPFTVSGGNAELDAAQLHLEEEIGDALFALANYARMLGIDPTVALDRTNRKFYQRFTQVEKEMRACALQMHSDHAALMRDFWNASKSAPHS